MYKDLNEKEMIDFLNPERCYNIGEYLFHNFNNLKKALFQDFSVVVANQANNDSLTNFYDRSGFRETPILICLSYTEFLDLQLYDLMTSIYPNSINNLIEEEKILIFGLCASLIMSDLLVIDEIKDKKVNMGYLSSVKLCYSFIFENKVLPVYPGLSECLSFELTPFGYKARTYAIKELKRNSSTPEIEKYNKEVFEKNFNNAFRKDFDGK